MGGFSKFRMVHDLWSDLQLELAQITVKPRFFVISSKIVKIGFLS
jgi:hypothetical protein